MLKPAPPPPQLLQKTHQLVVNYAIHLHSQLPKTQKTKLKAPSRLTPLNEPFDFQKEKPASLGCLQLLDCCLTPQLMAAKAILAMYCPPPPPDDHCVNACTLLSTFNLVVVRVLWVQVRQSSVCVSVKKATGQTDSCIRCSCISSIVLRRCSISSSRLCNSALDLTENEKQVL